jgi:hypothetical protein
MTEAYIKKPEQGEKQQAYSQTQRSQQPFLFKSAVDQSLNFESPLNKKLTQLQAMASCSPLHQKNQAIAQQIQNSQRSTVQLEHKSKMAAHIIESMPISDESNELFQCKSMAFGTINPKLNLSVFQLVNLKPASTSYQPSDKLEEERSQKERIRDETEVKDGSIVSTSIDQEPLPREALVQAKFDKELGLWIDVLGGNTITGSYDFIMQPDKESSELLWMIEETVLTKLRSKGKDYGHVSLARLLCEDDEDVDNVEAMAVAYAGGISFIDGDVIEWNGASGHFQPPDLNQQDWSAERVYRNLELEKYNSNPHKDIVDSEVAIALNDHWVEICRVGKEALENNLSGGYLAKFAQKELKDVLIEDAGKLKWGKNSRAAVIRGYVKLASKDENPSKGSLAKCMIDEI